MADQAEIHRYPLLEEMLALRDMRLQATYTIRDLGKLFEVSVRAIRNYVSSGKLTIRDLPGRAEFLPCDLEEFLRRSKRGGVK